MLESKFPNLSTNTKVKPCKCKASVLVPFKPLVMMCKPTAYLFNLFITQKSIRTAEYLRPFIQVLWRQTLRAVITIFTSKTTTTALNRDHRAVHISLSRSGMRTALNNQRFKRVNFLSEICRPRGFCLKPQFWPIGNQTMVITQQRQNGLVNDPYILLSKLRHLGYSNAFGYISGRISYRDTPCSLFNEIATFGGIGLNPFSI